MLFRSIRSVDLLRSKRPKLVFVVLKLDHQTLQGLKVMKLGESSEIYTDYKENVPCDYGDHRNHFLPVLYSLFFVVGFLGNVLVLRVIMVGAQLKMTDVCLLNLALADLLLVLFVPFLAYYADHSWIFVNAMCNLLCWVIWWHLFHCADEH